MAGAFFRCGNGGDWRLIMGVAAAGRWCGSMEAAAGEVTA